MLKKILIALAILLVLVVVVGLGLPGSYRVERSTLIHAPPEVIHGLVADLERWKEWTPWRPENSSGTQWMFGGPRGGVGAVRSWSGELGTGTLSLTRSDPKTGVAYDTSLEGGHYLMQGQISFTPADGGTRVTWVEEGSVGVNPLMHYLLPLIQSQLGARFEQGLAQLQKQAEAVPPPVEVKPAPGPPPVEQATASSRPPDSAPPSSVEAAPAPAPTDVAAPAVAATTEAAALTDGGVATAPPMDASTPPAAAETAPAPVTPAPAGAEPASASALPNQDPPSEKPTSGASAPDAPASAPVAGQTVPPT